MQTPAYGKRASLIVGTVVSAVVFCAGGCLTGRQCSPYAASPNNAARSCSDPNCPVHGRTPLNAGQPVAKVQPMTKAQPIANPQPVVNSRPPEYRAPEYRLNGMAPQPSRHYVGQPLQADLLSMILGGFRGPQPSVQRPVQAQAAPQPTPRTTSPIQQVTYRAPAPQAAKSSTDSELHKPWDLNAIRYQSNTVSPYRLVSEQSDDGKVPPPTGVISRLTAPTPTLSTQPTQQPPTSSRGVRLPIFDLGKDLAKEFRPSNDRKWTPNHAVLQTAEINGNLVTVHNIRYSIYESEDKYTPRYYDATFNLNDIRTLDVIIVPFRSMPRVAHVESSFGFADGRHLGMSIEARYEEGEKYDPAGAALNQFELVYVFADERDLIRLGTDVHKNDVHVYRLRFEPHEVRMMFIDAIERANRLAAKPEFYHPLRNSCVTNLIAHVNKGRPKSIPKEYRTLLPGLMDNYLYDLKLIDTTAASFKEAKENAKVNWLVEKYGDLEYFSAGIRQNMY